MWLSFALHLNMESEMCSGVPEMERVGSLLVTQRLYTCYWSFKATWPFVQRCTAGSCSRGPSSSWHLHPASYAALPAPSALSPPVSGTGLSCGGETHKSEATVWIMESIPQVWPASLSLSLPGSSAALLSQHDVSPIKQTHVDLERLFWANDGGYPSIV